MGSPALRSVSDVIAAGELGWKMSGFMRGIGDVAMRAAKYRMLPIGDFHGEVFAASHDGNKLSWADRRLIVNGQLIVKSSTPNGDLPCEYQASVPAGGLAAKSRCPSEGVAHLAVQPFGHLAAPTGSWTRLPSIIHDERCLCRQQVTKQKY